MKHFETHERVFSVLTLEASLIKELSRTSHHYQGCYDAMHLQYFPRHGSSTLNMVTCSCSQSTFIDNMSKGGPV
jgi:hypothetical protein